MIKLPSNPLPAVTDWSAYKWLIMGDPGVGKSGLLASIPNILLVDPEQGLKGYAGLRVDLTNWAEHLELRDALVKSKGAGYKGIGLDSLNVSYDHCSTHISRQLQIKHPSELAHGTGWQRITTEFIGWLRDMTLLGLPLIATCHTTITEVKVKNVTYNRWIPAFVGGGPNSTFAHIQKVFDVVGFMTFEEILAPPTSKKAGTTSVDLRADTSDLVAERRVIHFAPSTYWSAQDISRQLPDRVILSDDWSEDWSLIQAAWGTSGRQHLIENDEIQTSGLVKNEKGENIQK